MFNHKKPQTSVYLNISIKRFKDREIKKKKKLNKLKMSQFTY